jgi:hypothetical protein
MKVYAAGYESARAENIFFTERYKGVAMPSGRTRQFDVDEALGRALDLK